jgi:hypothetical protein
MNRLQRNLWFCGAVLSAIGVTVFILGGLLTDPAHAVPDLGGDGIKNIFTYLYQCMYGKGCWFDGMNYPYGEHIVYTDGQPALSAIITFFGNILPGAALIIMWLIIGFSYVLSMVYLYRILAYYDVAPLASIVFSAFICFFSPQLFRLQSHYSLSYACIIPMLFYWTIKYYQNSQWRYCLYVFMLGCVVAFLHPYFVAMILVWCCCYAIGYFIFTPASAGMKTRHVLPLAASVAGVFIVMSAVMKLTDPVIDRPQTPVSNIDANTTLIQVYTSEYSAFWQHVKNITKFTFPDWAEGYAYIGLVGTAVLLLSVALALYKRLKKDKATFEIKTKFPAIWLFIAFAALLFSMGIPFIWHLEWLKEYLSVFRQFRSLGRFSWIFYYIITTYSCIYIYALFAHLKTFNRPISAYVLLFAVLIVWSYEAKGYVKFSRDLGSRSPDNFATLFSVNEQNWESWLRDRRYNKNDFQAVLVLPFFHEGTEKLWVSYPGSLMTLGAKASLQLQLPIIDVKLSRSSWSQAFKQVKIAAGPFADKPMLRELKSNKPFLLLRSEKDSLNPDQQYLLTASEFIGHFSQCSAYACFPDRITANDKKWHDSIASLLPMIHTGDTCINCKGLLYINHFDSSHAEMRLNGAGAVPTIRHEDSLITILPVRRENEGQQYEFSCWFLVGTRDSRSPNIDLHFLDSTGKTITITGMLARGAVDNYDMWLRASGYFYMKRGCRYLKLVLVNFPNPAYKAMDEMMLRPADALIISKNADGSVMVNNHLYQQR